MAIKQKMERFQKNIDKKDREYLQKLIKQKKKCLD